MTCFKQGGAHCPSRGANQLAAMIRTAWENDALRAKTAEAGYRYAKSVGGEQELYQRVLAQLARLYP